MSIFVRLWVKIPVFYENEWNWEFIILGPLELKPEPIVPIAEPEPTGEVVLDLDLVTRDMICESKGGSVGEEGEDYFILALNLFHREAHALIFIIAEIGCWEADESLTNPIIITFKAVKMFYIWNYSNRRLIDDSKGGPEWQRQLQSSTIELKCILSDYVRNHTIFISDHQISFTNINSFFYRLPTHLPS
jgi:hypothetical protein